MKQLLQKNAFQLTVFAMLIICSYSLTPSTWCTNALFPQKAQSITTQFKMLNGSNRIAEFNSLCKIIFNQQPTNNLKLTTNNYSLSDLEKILGNPSKIEDNNNCVYNLSYNKNPNAIFSLNKITHSITCSIINY